MISYNIHEYRFIFREDDFSISVYYNKKLMETDKVELIMDADSFFKWCCNWYKNNVC